MKVLAALVGLVFVFTLSVPAVAAETEDHNKLQEIQKKLEESKKKLIETKQKEEQALSELVVAKDKLKKATKNLNRVNNKIVENQAQIQEMVTELKETHEDLTKKSVVLRNRLREVYKSSTVNYLELLLFSTNMSDFINRFYFFSKIIELDSSLIEDISRNYSTIQVNKEVLTKKTGEIKGLAHEIEEDKKTISTQADEIKELYGELKDRRELYEKQVAELEKSSKEMEKTILAKMAERRKQKIVVSGNTGALDWPLRGRITSVYGVRRHPYWGGGHIHTGIDVAAPYGEVIRAADGGEVIFSGWWDGYGKAIVIDHGKNMTTLYAHMSRLYLQVGNQVKKSQIIGLVGSTGYSTGPHLHFEVRINGKPQNPAKYLP